MSECKGGDREALEKLLPLVYDELHRRAVHLFSQERSGHTLQPTALVSDVYLQLVNQRKTDWQNRAQFFTLAARMMRRILVSHARSHRAGKRGGAETRITLVEEIAAAPERDVNLLAVDEALTRLDEIDPEKSRMVELRFFSGHSSALDAVIGWVRSPSGEGAEFSLDLQLSSSFNREMKAAKIYPVCVASALFLSVLSLTARAQSGPYTLQTFPVGNFPLALVSDGANIWVANQGDSTVTKLRASDGANLGTFPVGADPEGLTFDGANIWTSNYESANVTKLRGSDGALLGTFTVDSLPSGIAYDGANIWVTSVGQGTITKLRASDGVILGKFPVGDHPYYALFDGTSIWVSVFGGQDLVKLDPTNGSVLGRVQMSYGPEGMVFDGVKIWVALSVAPGMITAVRADDGKIVGTVKTSNSSVTGLTFDGRQIWVTDYFDNAVKKFAANSGASRGGGGPVDTPLGMCFDGTSVWVGNGDDATVTKITPAMR